MKKGYRFGITLPGDGSTVVACVRAATIDDAERIAAEDLGVRRVYAHRLATNPNRSAGQFR